MRLRVVLISPVVKNALAVNVQMSQKRASMAAVTVGVNTTMMEMDVIPVSPVVRNTETAVLTSLVVDKLMDVISVMLTLIVPENVKHVCRDQPEIYASHHRIVWIHVRNDLGKAILIRVHVSHAVVNVRSVMWLE